MARARGTIGLDLGFAFQSKGWDQDKGVPMGSVLKGGVLGSRVLIHWVLGFGTTVGDSNSGLVFG